MIIKLMVVILLVLNLLIMYKLSVTLDRMEDNLVDIEITYTKLQQGLRRVDACIEVLSDVRFVTVPSGESAEQSA